MTMNLPTDTDFDKLETLVSEVLFNMTMTGRASTKAGVTGIRWVIERDNGPYWLISIFGFGLDDQMALDTIVAFLAENDYDPTTIEIILEANDDAI